MLAGRPRRSSVGGATAVRITTILTAVGCCLAAVAYAATRSLAPYTTAYGERSPLRPRIVGHPERVTTETTARFDFSQPGRPPRRALPGQPVRMECRLDEGSWEPCASPLILDDVARGGHRFGVRAVNRAGTAGPVADFGWWRARVTAARVAGPMPPAEELVHRSAAARPGSGPIRPQTEPPPPVEAPPVEEPEAPADGPPFAIRQIGSLGDLFPGAPPETIGVLIENPDGSPVTVTALSARIAADAPDCPATENFILTPAAVSPAAPIVVAGESTLSLPEAGIAGPTIAMADLPRSQDGCQGDELEIALSGEGVR